MKRHLSAQPSCPCPARSLGSPLARFNLMRGEMHVNLPLALDHGPCQTHANRAIRETFKRADLLSGKAAVKRGTTTAGSLVEASFWQWRRQQTCRGSPGSSRCTVRSDRSLLARPWPASMASGGKSASPHTADSCLDDLEKWVWRTSGRDTESVTAAQICAYPARLRTENSCAGCSSALDGNGKAANSGASPRES